MSLALSCHPHRKARTPIYAPTLPARPNKTMGIATSYRLQTFVSRSLSWAFARAAWDLPGRAEAGRQAVFRPASIGRPDLRVLDDDLCLVQTSFERCCAIRRSGDHRFQQE